MEMLAPKIMSWVTNSTCSAGGSEVLELREEDCGVSVATSSEMWASPQNVLIFLDWDDTIFPTSWLKSIPEFEEWQTGARQAEDVLTEGQAQAMKELDSCARAFLIAASQLGRIAIVTLARRGWVERSREAFLPQLSAAWAELNIDVRYASEEKSSLRHGRVGQWVREDREEQHALITELHSKHKQRSMEKALKRFYGRSSWKNVLGIGDSMFERRALQDIGFEHANPLSSKTGQPKELRIKTVKLLEDPPVESMVEQFQAMQAWLPRMVACSTDFDADFADSINFADFQESLLEGI